LLPEKPSKAQNLGENHLSWQPFSVSTFGNQPMKLQHIPNNELGWDAIVVPQNKI
jgi:hypothetical protein